MKIRYLLLILAVGGCATAAEKEGNRMRGELQRTVAFAKPCFDALDARVEQGPLKDKMPPTGQNTASLALLSDNTKPTAEQAQYLFALHAEMQQCRKLVLENIGAVHPSLVTLFADAYAAQDQRYVRLVNRQITWGENAQAATAAKADFQNRATVAVQRIDQQLANAHAYEVQQRQQAAQALMVWGMYQQQLELQRQAIAASTRPTMTTCNYVGRQLQCTSY